MMSAFGIDQIAAEDIVSVAVFCIYLFAGLFCVRGAVVFLARSFGLYDPDQYSKWPRFPWRIFFKFWMNFKIWRERVFLMGKHSTGGFAGVLPMLSLMYRPGQILLGRAYGFGFGLLQPIGIHVQRHLFMYAMTGSGKTTALATILSSWRGSASLIDPKAQVVNALIRHDRREWFVLDPYGISIAESASFNALDCINAAVERDGPDAAVLWSLRVAEALIVTPSGSKTPYFCDVSRQFLAGLILHVITTHPEDQHNLPCVRDLIVQGLRVYDDDGNEMTKDGEAQALLLRAMQNNQAFEGAIAGAAVTMASASGETGGNVRSTLQEQTKWLDIPQVRKVLRSTTMPLSWLKTRDDVVFAFTAPLFSLREELSPLSRLVTNMIAYTFESVKQKKGPCLSIVDELPSQKFNPTILVTLAAGRSYGQVFFGIAQSTELMKQNYPNAYKSFDGEADAVFWMGGNHPDSAAHLSQALGKKTLVEKDKYSGRKTYREISVMDPEQIKRFLDPNSDNLIVTRAGGRALKLKNEPYFKALPVWKYAPDPEHKEAFLRRISRKLFDPKSKLKEEIDNG